MADGCAISSSRCGRRTPPGVTSTSGTSIRHPSTPTSPAPAALLRMLLGERPQTVLLCGGEIRDERRDGSRFGDSGERDRGVNAARWSPFVAEVFERQERGAQLFSLFVILSRARNEECAAQFGSEHAGAGGESAQTEITQVHDGGTFANPADDARPVHALEQSRKVRIDGGVFAHHGVLDADAD